MFPHVLYRKHQGVQPIDGIKFEHDLSSWYSPKGAGSYVVKSPISDLQGLTPLHVAAQHEHPELVEILLSHGADVTAQDTHVGRLIGQDD